VSNTLSQCALDTSVNMIELFLLNYEIELLHTGTEIIPGPVEEFHAFLVTDNSVGVAWDAPTGYNITQYQVFYQLRDAAVSTAGGTAVAAAAKPMELKSVRLE